MSILKFEFFAVTMLISGMLLLGSARVLRAEEAVAEESAESSEASADETVAEENDEEFLDEEDMGEDPNEFFRSVAGTPNATVYQGMRVAYILMTGNQLSVEFERVRAYLLVHRVINRGWLDYEADDYITFGEISYLVAGAVELSGGVMYTLTDWLGMRNQRYAHRELIFRGIVPASNTTDFVRGVELLTIMQGASEYITARRIDQELSGVVEEIESGNSEENEAESAEESSEESSEENSEENAEESE
ncbi:MAG: hypothetical protein NUW37_14980 [Planctomycetes bacterium]|nr:hypothetical protein [Planctomycetota bacterium]